jgi:hypothetical protein
MEQPITILKTMGLTLKYTIVVTTAISVIFAIAIAKDVTADPLILNAPNVSKVSTSGTTTVNAIRIVHMEPMMAAEGVNGNQQPLTPTELATYATTTVCIVWDQLKNVKFVIQVLFWWMTNKDALIDFLTATAIAPSAIH